MFLIRVESNYLFDIFMRQDRPFSISAAVQWPISLIRFALVFGVQGGRGVIMVFMLMISRDNADMFVDHPSVLCWVRVS